MSLANTEQLGSAPNNANLNCINLNCTTINGVLPGYTNNTSTGTGAGPYLVYNQPLPAGHVLGGHIDISISANNGTDYAIKSWSQYLSVINKANTSYVTTSEVGGSTALSTGVFTTTTTVLLVLVSGTYYLQVGVSVATGFATNVVIASNAHVFIN